MDEVLSLKLTMGFGGTVWEVKDSRQSGIRIENYSDKQLELGSTLWTKDRNAPQRGYPIRSICFVS